MCGKKRAERDKVEAGKGESKKWREKECERQAKIRLIHDFRLLPRSGGELAGRRAPKGRMGSETPEESPVASAETPRC